MNRVDDPLEVDRRIQEMSTKIAYSRSSAIPDLHCWTSGLQVSDAAYLPEARRRGGVNLVAVNRSNERYKLLRLVPRWYRTGLDQNRTPFRDRLPLTPRAFSASWECRRYPESRSQELAAPVTRRAGPSSRRQSGCGRPLPDDYGRPLFPLESKRCHEMTRRAFVGRTRKLRIADSFIEPRFASGLCIEA